uniref:DNA polymerase epsilon subunit 3 n=1 Tax=Panagrellus redivivus TaxID=6233 RepID=A0A7E4UXH1_PANRE
MSLPCNITNAEDVKLPMAPVLKIIKKAAGESHTFSNEFKVACSRAASVFMLQTVDIAVERSKKEGRATINPNDVIGAMEPLGHEDFQEKLRKALEAYRTKKAAKSAKKADK